MGKKRVGAILGSLVILATAGCNSQDTEALANIGRIVKDKAAAAAGGMGGKFDWNLPTLRGNPEGSSLETRVTDRLGWDKGLDGAEIRVEVQDNGVVELKGSVRDLSQRRRAVDLAESTTGVEKVTDSLETPPT